MFLTDPAFVSSLCCFENSMRIIQISFLSLLLSGCIGPLIPVENIRELPPKLNRKVLALPIYNESQLDRGGYHIINMVEGISCKNQAWDPAATKIAAINQAKYWAYKMGANALLNIRCEYPRSTTLTYNCWESITCTAQAILMKSL